MLYNYELAREICHEMGIKWNPDATGVSLRGKQITEDFNFKDLFRNVCSDTDTEAADVLLGGDIK